MMTMIMLCTPPPLPMTASDLSFATMLMLLDPPSQASTGSSSSSTPDQPLRSA